METALPFRYSHQDKCKDCDLQPEREEINKYKENTT